MKKIIYLTIIIAVIIGGYKIATKNSKEIASNCEAVDLSTVTFSNPSEKFLSSAEIGEEILHVWFSEYQKNSICDAYRITEYTVNEVYGLTSEGSIIEVGINADIQPVNVSTSNWIMGNGMIDGDWIRNKAFIFTISKEGTTYTLTDVRIEAETNIEE